MRREDVSPNTENADMRVDLEKAMMRLPRRQREVLALRYFADLDIQEIADGMGVKEGTVKALLFRGRHALADSIGQPEADDPDER